MTKHPDTIGRITVGDVEYDIDWPHLMDSDTEREDFGVIYSTDGALLSDFINQDWRPDAGYDGFDSRAQVLEHARRFIEAGGLDRLREIAGGDAS